MDEYKKKTPSDVRMRYKSETGQPYGKPVNDKRNSKEWFRDEYVEWLEELAATTMDAVQMVKHIVNEGGQA